MFSKEYFQSLESSWDRLKTCEKPIFIYGMGDGAEKLLDEFPHIIGCAPFVLTDAGGGKRRPRPLGAVPPRQSAGAVLP